MEGVSSAVLLPETARPSAGPRLQQASCGACSVGYYTQEESCRVYFYRYSLHSSHRIQIFSGFKSYRLEEKKYKIHKLRVAPGDILLMSEKWCLYLFFSLRFPPPPSPFHSCRNYPYKQRELTVINMMISAWVNSLENWRSKTFFFIFFNLLTEI